MLFKLVIINFSTVTGEFGRCDHANDHSQQFLSVICLYFMNFVFLLIKLYLLKGVVIWPCLKRTGKKQIREFDWLRSILTLSWPRSRFSHLDRHLDWSCCNSCPQKVTNKEYEKIGLFVQKFQQSWTLSSFFAPFRLETSDRRKPAKCWSPRGEANKISYVFVPLLSCLVI